MKFRERSASRDSATFLVGEIPTSRSPVVSSGTPGFFFFYAAATNERIDEAHLDRETPTHSFTGPLQGVLAQILEGVRRGFHRLGQEDEAKDRKGRRHHDEQRASN